MTEAAMRMSGPESALNQIEAETSRQAQADR